QPRPPAPARRKRAAHPDRRRRAAGADRRARARRGRRRPGRGRPAELRRDALVTRAATVILCAYTERRWPDLVAAIGSVRAQSGAAAGGGLGVPPTQTRAAAA